MIDKLARQNSAKILEEFYAGRLSTWDFEDQWPQADDRVINDIIDLLNSVYNENKNSKLDPDNLTDQGRIIIQNSIRFLRTDAEYKWPVYPLVPTGLRYFQDLLMSRAEDEKNWNQYCASGNFNYWPFLKEEQFREHQS
jgi:hypothetical protein